MDEPLDAERSERHPLLFRDPATAAHWLAVQPQANVPVMLANLQLQIASFSRIGVTPRERFRTLEVLRKTVFGVTGACQRRFENRPLPLTPPEQEAFDAACRLWKTVAAAYSICLDACGRNEPALSRRAAVVAHRVFACLRREQMQCYAAGIEPGPDFWKRLHATFFAAERLGVVSEPIEDRLLGETRESTVGGQYAMAVMLHLSRPDTLPSGHFAAVVRWLARWRERAAIVASDGSGRHSATVLLDLAGNSPVHMADGVPRMPRRLSLERVVRKIRSRVAALDAGQLPENIRLGGGLSAATCQTLLKRLERNLRRPPAPLPDVIAGCPRLAVATGLKGIHAVMGGEGVRAGPDSNGPVNERLVMEQLAVFGHAVRDVSTGGREPLERHPLESWQLVTKEPEGLMLLRPAGEGASRLALRSLLAIRQRDHFRLAVVSGVRQRFDRSLCVSVELFPKGAQPRTMEVRDKTTGRLARHPAFEVAAVDGKERWLLIPAGVMPRAAAVRFFDAGGEALAGFRPGDCLERGGEVDFWRLAPG